MQNNTAQYRSSLALVNGLHVHAGNRCLRNLCWQDAI